MDLKEISVSFPFGLGSFRWAPNEKEKEAAWSLYVELVTRIATQELADTQGSDAEALSSLYSLFGSTRRVLRRAGPTAGVRRGSFGGVAIAVLNVGLRPFLTKWRRASLAAGPNADLGTEFRKELRLLRHELASYAELLAIIAGIGDQV